MTAIPHPLTGTHDDAHDHAHEHGHSTPFVSKYVFSTDHKVIGIQFLFIGLLFMVLGGLLAMLVRWQLAWPDNSARGLTAKAVPILGRWLWPVVDPATGQVTAGNMPVDFYYMAFSMHASIM